MKSLSSAWLLKRCGRSPSRSVSLLDGIGSKSLTCRRAELKSSTRRYASSFSSDTIFALSTAPGKAAIAIIRISGPACLSIYRVLCPDKPDPKPRYANLRALYAPVVSRNVSRNIASSRIGTSSKDKQKPVSDLPLNATAAEQSRYESSDTIAAESSSTSEASNIAAESSEYDLSELSPAQPPRSELLDSNALVLYFPSPNTVTGEDLLELHVHGGPAIVQAILRAIPRCVIKEKVRFAEQGEFTKRAFYNNKLDLTQVEALGEVLSATTEQQRKLSLRNTGSLAKKYEEWRNQLLYARGELEALIDFSEDQHFDESVSDLLSSVSAQVHNLVNALNIHIQNAVRGELLRNGISISLLGAPNAGKSSLLNAIVGREAAIVSQEAGTTRDVVEIGLDIGGYFCRFGDTAGLRQSHDKAEIGQVEVEGMRRAKLRAEESDVSIIVLELRRTPEGITPHLDTEVIETATQLLEERKVVVVINKIDLTNDDAILRSATQQVSERMPTLDADSIYLVSCKSHVSDHVANQGVGSTNTVQAFLNGLTHHFQSMTAALSSDNVADASVWQESLGATERHKLLLEDCLASLKEFLDVSQPVQHDVDDEADVVVAAEQLRAAAESLAKITGRGDSGDVEEVLGVVFEKFCVGK